MAKRGNEGRRTLPTREVIASTLKANKLMGVVRSALESIFAEQTGSDRRASSYMMGPGRKTLYTIHKGAAKSHAGKTKSRDGGSYIKEGRATYSPPLYQRTRVSPSGIRMKIGEPATRMRHRYLRRKERQFDRRAGIERDDGDFTPTI